MKYDPYEQEKLICKITGQRVLQPIYENTYFQKDKDGHELRWSVRVPIPGVGTEKRRYWGDFTGKDLRDLWSNVLWGCGWALRYSEDQTGYEYYQKTRYDRALKRWVEIDGT